MRLLHARALAAGMTALAATAPLFSQALPQADARPERSLPAPALSGARSAYEFASYTEGDSLPWSGAVGGSEALPHGALPARQTHEGPEVYSVQVPMNDLIRFYLDYYSTPGGIDWLTQILRRAQPFRGFIASRIAYYHLPPELIYLPIVESTYDPYAVSYTGAAGLWQFMTNSIGPYDIRINEWIDERFDFWKSTDASLQKLKYNYEVLGDWLLALAAYNAGLGALMYVIDKSGLHDVWQLAAQGYLSYETKQYIPKFLAIAAICSYGGRNGIPLDWSAPVRWDRLKLDQSVDLRILAREAQVPLAQLLEGNAELRYAITPPESSDYYLKVPASEEAAIASTLRQQRFKLMRFYIYSVTSGDTLYDLSRYYGVPVSMILQYNPGVQPKSLQLGTRLVIPGIKDLPPYRRASASSASEPVDTKSFVGTYTVQPGDTLWSISLRYSTSVEALAQANGLSLTGLLHDGDSLRVPLTSSLIEASAQ